MTNPDNHPPEKPKEIMRLSASKPRRAIMLLMIAALGVLVITLGFRMGSGQFALKIVFVLAGIGIFALLPRLAYASARSLILTEQGLSDETGTLLVHVDNMRGIDRGAFAFKPSNGFAIRLHKPVGRAWVPGLWWLGGRRMGVGGLIPAGPAKAVAEILAELTREK